MLLPGILMSRIDADSKVFLEPIITSTSNHSVISQLQTVSKLQCLHKCKMMNENCSDIVFQNSEVGNCLLLAVSNGNTVPLVGVEEAMKSFGMAAESSRRASPVQLPSSMHLIYALTL